MTGILEGEQLLGELRGREPLTGSIRLRERKSDSQAVLDEFQIKGVLHAGGSCICYKAVRIFEESGLAEAGTLKEFYPADSRYEAAIAFHLKRHSPAAGANARHLYSAASTLSNFISARNEFRKCYEKISALKLDKKKYDYFFEPVRFYRGVAADDCADNYTLYIWHPGDSGLQSYADYLEDAFLRINEEAKAPSGDLNLMLACELHTVLQAIRMLATGINNLHMEDFLHLDIKPANFGIRMSEKGKVASVSLFDINTIYPRSYTGRRTAGTPFFRAPEMTGDTHNNAKNIAVGCRSDIYSLGATLYNSIVITVNGRGLYEPKKFQDIDADLSRSLLMELSDYNSRAELQSLLLKILKCSLARRDADYISIGQNYRSVGAFLRDISRAEDILDREISDAKKAGAGNKAVVSIVSNEEYYAAEADGGAAGSMQRLLYDTPLYDYTDSNGDVNILVLGAGVFGQKFTDTAFQLAQIKSCRPYITVVSKDKERDEERYLAARPEFRKYFSVNGEAPQWSDYGIPGSISFAESELAIGDLSGSESNSGLQSAFGDEKGKKFSYIFISLSDEQLNRELALEIAGSALVGRGANGKAVISFVTYRAEGGARGEIFAEKQAELAGKGIILKPVRVTDTLLNHKDYTALCEMAFNCHLLWNGSLNADIKRLYEEFRAPYTFRGSLANALSLKYKLHSMGLDISEALSEKNKRLRAQKLLKITKRFRELIGSGVPYGEKTPAQQQCISELMLYEHRRWLVNMITDLSYGLLPEEDYHMLVASNRDSSARRHACLVPSAQTHSLHSDFWSKNLAVWDAPDIEQNAEFQSLDPLDRASVMLHRHFVSVAMKTDYEAAENDASVVRNHLSGSPEVLSAFNSYMIALRNMMSVLKKSIQGEYIDRTLAENQVRLAQRCSRAVKRLLRADNQEITRRLGDIESAYAPVRRAIAYTRYKDNDEKLVEGIPFMLNFSSDTRLIIPFVSGKSNNKWFENAASSIAVNPSSVTYLISTEGSEEELSALKDVMKYICTVMDNHNLQTRLGLLLFADSQSAVLQKTAVELKGISSRITGVDILLCEDEKSASQALMGVVTAAASGSGFVAAELNSTYLGGLLSSLPVFDVPSYRFDCADGRFTSEQGYIWLEDIPFTARLSIDDMFLSQGKLGVYHEAELHKDYREIWSSCYSDGSGDTRRAVAWNALCRAVKKKTDAQNIILRLSTDKNRIDCCQNVQKAFFVPEFCAEAAEKIFGFFASPQVNMLNGLQITTHNSSMLKISFSASSEVCRALYSLLSDPYMLTQAECIRLSLEDGIASVYFDSLIVNDFCISDVAEYQAEGEELVEYASEAFGYLAEKGYIAVFEDDEGKNAVDFCFASAEIKELLTDECRLPELYVYYQLTDTGYFDEIRNGLCVQNKTEDFIQSPSARFDIVTVKGFRSQIVEVKSAQYLKKEFYQELQCNGDMYGINKELILVNAMGDAPHCSEAEAYGIRTVCSLNEIENIGNTLVELMENVSVGGRRV